MKPVSLGMAVADLMTQEPIVVRASDRIDEAEAILRDFRIGGLPVVDEDDHLVGVISQSDLLHLRRPRIADLIRVRASRLLIGDVMSQPPVIIDTQATMEDAAQVMVEHEIHRLVATDRDGRPIGVLTSMDFVRMIAVGSDEP